MRNILTLIIILFYQFVIGQEIITTDSVNIRILNKGKHYIKEYILTIDGKDFKYMDVWKKKYSDYQQLPYIWTSNESKTTVIIKQMFNYDKWVTISKLPIDHVGEKQMTSGYFTIIIRTRRIKDNLDVEEILTKVN